MIYFLVDQQTKNILYTYEGDTPNILYCLFDITDTVDIIGYIDALPSDFEVGVCYRWKYENGQLFYDNNLSQEYYDSLLNIHTKCCSLLSLQQRIDAEQTRILQNTLPLQPLVYDLKYQEAQDYLNSDKVEDSTRWPLVAGTATSKNINFETAAKLIMFVRDSKISEIKQLEITRETEKARILSGA